MAEESQNDQQGAAPDPGGEVVNALPPELVSEISTALTREFPVSGKPRELRELATVAEKAIAFYQHAALAEHKEQTHHLNHTNANRKSLENVRLQKGQAARNRVISLKATPGNDADLKWLLSILERALIGELFATE